jgi:hypothetical protein
VECAAALGLALALSLAGSHADRVPSFRLEPAKTWVGIARVHLAVSELTVVGDALVGIYEIRVPLAPSKDDRGTVRFELTRPLETALVEGGSLVGLGKSELDHRTHHIRCAFGDGESVQIVVDTPERRLQFQSRWTAGT